VGDLVAARGEAFGDLLASRGDLRSQAPGGSAASEQGRCVYTGLGCLACPPQCVNKHSNGDIRTRRRLAISNAKDRRKKVCDREDLNEVMMS
jgi:hypothetical protein